MTKLSNWLNVKESLETTIEHLLKLKPPVKKNKKSASDTVKEFAHKCNPPRNIDFSDADMTRNHHAHGITKSVGKWNDEKLQRLSTLALELVECLGDEDAFESLLIIKRNLSSELAEQYALPMKRKHENNEDEFQERKRHMSDEELGELIDFALNIVNKL
ncbi:12618_t:CDS:2 [Funneliformis geosporum]|uniref:12618_t:CDS:1 n=1 Tax=Funneliformis geosporum TaxID=1117311 RepID=A0A9W4WV33_9GLOM|nr:12618_t:CDS:2 [Funneliformis geosporum]